MKCFHWHRVNKTNFKDVFLMESVTQKIILCTWIKLIKITGRIVAQG